MSRGKSQKPEGTLRKKHATSTQYTMENKLPAGKSTSSEDHGLSFSQSVVSDCDPVDCGSPRPLSTSISWSFLTPMPMEWGDAIAAHNTLSIYAVNKPVRESKLLRKENF